MAKPYWMGGASVATQEQTYTPANVEIGDVFTLTSYSPDRSESAVVSFTATAATVANVCTGLAAAWNASNSQFCTGVTADDDTTHVTLTADAAGVPFDVDASATDGGGTDTQTLTEATVTANAGPNDYNTGANWDGGVVPSSTDEVRILDSEHPILYGLYQVGVSPALVSIGRTMKADVGDKAGGYKLRYTTATVVRIDTGGDHVGLDGPMPSVFVRGCSTSDQAVVLGANADIDNLRVGGARVLGKVTVKSGAVLDNAYVQEAQKAQLVVESGVTSFDLIEADSGIVETESVCDVINACGAAYVKQESATSSTTVNVRTGGTVDYRSGGTLTNENVLGGTFDLTNSQQATLTITNAIVEGGHHNADGALVNVTYTNDIVRNGGRVSVDSGVTIQQ